MSYQTNRTNALTVLVVLAAATLAARDKPLHTYELGIYAKSVAVNDGSTTNDIRCGRRSLGSTVCSGDVRLNAVVAYRIDVSDGNWRMVTERQARDSAQRRISQGYNSPCRRR